MNMDIDKPDVAVEESAKVDNAESLESKRLKQFYSCVQSSNEKMSEEIKQSLAKLYEPLIGNDARKLEKIHKTCMDLYTSKVNSKLQRIFDEHELSKKLKKLEEIAELPDETTEKFWRPTGLSTMQQQKGRDMEIHESFKKQLENILQKKEAELKELIAKKEKIDSEALSSLMERVDSLKNDEAEVVNQYFRDQEVIKNDEIV